jgi:iron complex transport system substrate-binding protein
MPGSRRSSLVAMLVALLTLGTLSGCATRDEAPAQAAAAGGAFPVRLTPPGGAPQLTLDRRPERIVSLSPTSTETLFAVGAGPQVVAVDSASTHPAKAPHTALSALTPDPEAIAALTPDLVVVSADTHGLSAALAKAGIKTLVLPDARTLDDAFAEFSLVGTATGHAAEGEGLARRTRDGIDRLVAETPKPARPLRYYHELDPTYFSVTSATFLGQLYARFGLINVADGADPNASGGYPQLSAERILQADPALIFLADTKCCGQNAETVGARPGWSTLSAIRSGAVIPLDDDVASRWGPRIVDMAGAISAAVTRAGK